jgi:hypothetical protein
MASSSFVFLFALVFIAACHSGHGLDSCASALQPIFAGAQGHGCVQLAITTASASTSAVSNTQGNVYFNRYYDGLVNQDTPSFSVLSNLNVGCARGVAQPFSAEQVSSRVAQNPFDVLVTREGVMRMAIGSQVFQNVTLACNNGVLPAVGFDVSGNVYTAQFKLFELSEGCPATVVGSSC